MLSLNPPTLSAALGGQLLEGLHYLRGDFAGTLLPLIHRRYDMRSLQRINSGSICVAGALTLFLVAYKRAPQIIAVVGTHIGNSAASLALGAGLSGQAVKLITCDLHPCIQQPLDGLSLPQGSGAIMVQGSSTQMFQALLSKQFKIDLLHLDGRPMPEDLKILGQFSRTTRSSPSTIARETKKAT